MKKYINKISIEADGECYDYQFETNSVVYALAKTKEGINEVIWMAIELEGFQSGAELKVSSIIEDENGDYVDSDENGIVKLHHIERTTTPSEYIAWDKVCTKPHIFKVDRANSSWTFDF